MVKKEELSVSVIIPCYNEEQNIAECVSRIPSLAKFTEIIVVDDGSRDATVEVAKSLVKKVSNLKIISYKPNKGKGNAVRTGMDRAKGDILVILDADMAVRPEDLPKFTEPLKEGRADFVNGTRFVYQMQKGAMKGINNFGNRLMGILFSLILRQKITDSLCGTKALFKKHYQKVGINKEDPWGDFSLLFGAAKYNLKLIEVPMKYHRRVAGKSKMSFLKDGYALFKLWIRLLWQNYL